MVGRSVGVGGEPFVERDVEVEELLRAVDGMDHLDVELSTFECGIVEVLDVVEEISGEGGVWFDHGDLKAEVMIVLGDLLIDRSTFDWDWNHRYADGLGAFIGEEAAIDLFLGGGRNFIVGGGDELHSGVFQLKGAVAVVGEDDKDWEKAVLYIGEAEEAAVLWVVAGLGCDGEVLVGMGLVGGIGGGGFGRRNGFIVCGAGGQADQDYSEDGSGR